MRISEMDDHLNKLDTADLNTLIRAINLLPEQYKKESGLSVVKCQAMNAVKRKKGATPFIISAVPPLVGYMKNVCRTQRIRLQISGNPVGLLFVRVEGGREKDFESILNSLGIDYNDKE